MNYMKKEKQVKKDRQVRKGIFVLLAVGLMAGAVGCGVKVERAGTERTTQESVGGMAAEGSARKARAAQDDFYAYVNGESLEKATLKYGDVYGGPISEMNDQIREEIFQVVKKVGDSKEVYPEGSPEAIVRATYLQYLEYLRGANAAGDGMAKGTNAAANETSVFEEAVSRIRGAENLDELLGVSKALAGEMGFVPFFWLELNNDFRRTGEYALYFEQKQTFGSIDVKEIYESDETRKQLLGMATDALVSVGEEPLSAKEKAKAYVYLILDVTFATDYSLEDEMDFDARYQFVSEEKMDEVLGGISIQTVEDVYNLRGGNPYGGYYVQDASQLKAIGKCFREENIEALKTWMTIELFVSYREFLAEKYPFVKLYLGGNFEELERIAARYVDGVLSEQVSQLYEKEYYTKEMDAFLERAYGDIKRSYGELIGGATWLSQETRDGLLDKLESLRFIKPGMGTVKEIRVSDAIGETAMQTACNLNRIKQEELRGLIGKPRDEGRLMMPMQVMNACYNPQNTFTVTVAIMHSPYFDPKASYEANLGGIGMVMAHEIGHAFDSNGFKFTAEGVYDPSWISEKDWEALHQNEQAMVE
ncbi:MAG: hypothetical protein IKS85_07360, partial [Lachnospiraceae bacterium]|nr:hypothetical protein [Lachnospiraceae bacterium]